MNSPSFNIDAIGYPGPPGPGMLGGTTDPTPTDGRDGDYWYNSASLTLFGPKAAGAWPAGVLLSTAQVAAAIAQMVTDFASGVHVENFALNTPITATNLNDAAAATFTPTYLANALQIALSTVGRTFAFSTKNIVAGKMARIGLTQQITVGTSFNCGFSIFDGVNRTTVTYSSLGRVFTSGAGTPTGNLSVAVPTLAAGDTLKWNIVSCDNGDLYFSVSKNGGAPYYFSMTGTARGAFALAMQPNSGAMTATHASTFEVLGSLESQQIAYTPPVSRALGGIVALLKLMQRVRPVGFFTTIPMDLAVYVFNGKFFSSMDLQPILDENDPTVGVLYVDITTGSDSNAGTSSAALKSLGTALGRFVGGKGIIKAKGNLYDQANSFNSAITGASFIQLVSWDGQTVISSMHDTSLTWTLGTSNTYSATFGNVVVNVWDAKPANLTSEGDYARLALATSQANCEATPGTYFISGTTIYVHTIDNRAPDAFIRVMKRQSTTANDYNFQFLTPNGTFYADNFQFEGGQYPFYTRLTSPATAQTLYWKNCAHKYGGINNLAVNGNALCLSQKCVSAWAGADGFNYHAIFGSAGPQVFEVDCVARRNGLDSTDTNNGSTTHETSMVIRVNGDYRFNQDRCVHDVTAAFSWNIGCRSGNSLTGNAAWAAGNTPTDTTKMWLDNCTSEGGPDLETQGNAVIYTAGHVATGTGNVAGSNVQTYTP